MKSRPFHHFMLRYNSTVTRMTKMIKMINKTSKAVRRPAPETHSNARHATYSSGTGQDRYLPEPYTAVRELPIRYRSASHLGEGSLEDEKP